MKDSCLLRHPAWELCAYLLVPLAVDLLALLRTPYAAGAPLLVLRVQGLLVAVSWGGAGLLLCVLAGVLVGLPIAGLQTAAWRARLQQVREGADPRQVLRAAPWTTGALPWLLTAGAAFLLGYPWLFPPLGGILMAVNVLWARTLVYHPHLLAWAYLEADEELRAQEAAAELPALAPARAGNQLH